MNPPSVKEIIQKITRGTSEIISADLLSQKIIECHKKNRKLKVKAGFDPTAPDIHLGHVVLLRKLRQFQDLGHDVYFIIGDFTAQIGDPTGRDQTRPPLDEKTIKENAKTYKDQVFKILDPQKTQVVFNSEWLKKLSSQQVLELSARCSVAQMLARADFKERFEEKKEISLLEFFYPLLQGYDSVHLESDIELGGTDQKFNLLMGRQLQEAYKQSPQVVVMTPLLEGTDGAQKMSKSLGNYISINESPRDMFGKIMSINDALMLKYFEFLTDENLSEIKSMHPKEAKLKLAQTIVGQFHSKAIAVETLEDFEKTFSQGKIPEAIEEFDLTKSQFSLADILLQVKFVPSKKEFMRLLQQGAISHNDQKISKADWRPQPGVLKVGKRRFLKLIGKPV